MTTRQTCVSSQGSVDTAAVTKRTAQSVWLLDGALRHCIGQQRCAGQWALIGCRASVSAAVGGQTSWIGAWPSATGRSPSGDAGAISQAGVTARLSHARSAEAAAPQPRPGLSSIELRWAVSKCHQLHACRRSLRGPRTAHRSKSGRGMGLEAPRAAPARQEPPDRAPAPGVLDQMGGRGDAGQQDGRSRRCHVYRAHREHLIQNAADLSVGSWL